MNASSTAPLALGDHVEVTYRTGSGPATWTGVVTGVDERLRLAHVTGHGRRIVVPRRGALYVRVRVVADTLWADFTETHEWPTPVPVTV